MTPASQDRPTSDGVRGPRQVAFDTVHPPIRPTARGPSVPAGGPRAHGAQEARGARPVAGAPKLLPFLSRATIAVRYEQFPHTGCHAGAAKGSTKARTAEGRRDRTWQQEP